MHIAELQSTETIIVRRHEELLEEVKTRHAKEAGVWKETSAENAKNLINDVRIAKVDSIKMSVKRNLILVL